MWYLILAIVSMCLFMLLLKIFTIKGWNIPQAIIINYLIAAIAGFLACKGPITVETMFANSWWYLAAISGVLFFFSSDLMAASTKWAGMAVTTISSRTALVVPIIFAVLFLGESVSTWEIIGVAMVIVSLFFIFWQKKDKNTISSRSGKVDVRSIILPIGVFLSMGGITVCMKTAQHIIKVSGEYATDFPMYQAMTFLVAVICGIVYYAFTVGKKAFRPEWKSVAGGIFVGVFNYLVTLAILNGLRVLPTSVFYASYNICVVIISVLISVLVFKEKLTPARIFGILLAVAAIAVLVLLTPQG